MQKKKVIHLLLFSNHPVFVGSEISTENIVFLKSAVFFSGGGEYVVVLLQMATAQIRISIKVEARGTTI